MFETVKFGSKIFENVEEPTTHAFTQIFINNSQMIYDFKRGQTPMDDTLETSDDDEEEKQETNTMIQRVLEVMPTNFTMAGFINKYSEDIIVLNRQMLKAQKTFFSLDKIQNDL